MGTNVQYYLNQDKYVKKENFLLTIKRIKQKKHQPFSYSDVLILKNMIT